MLRRFASLIVSVGLIVALGAVGLLASAGAHDKAEALHRRDRDALQATLAGLGNQYLRFALKGELDFASAGPWSLKPNDAADQDRLRNFVTHSQVLNYGAALVSFDRRPLNGFAVDPAAGLPPASDPGYSPLISALLNNEPGVSSVMRAGPTPVVALAVPVVVNGAPRAVMIAYSSVGSNPLQNYTEQLRYGKTGRGVLVDAQGNVVATADKTSVGGRVDPAVQAAVARGKAGFMETTIDGQKEVVSYAPIGLGGWMATTHQSAAEFYGPLQSGRRNIDRALAAVLVAAAVALIAVGYKRQSTARRDEAALRRSEQRFQSLARNAFDVVTVFSADGTILYDSPAIERVLGYTPEERLGDIVTDYLHPDDQGRAADILVRVLDKPGALVQLEVRGKRSDGEWRWLELGVTNLLDDPSVRGIVANQRDITERRAFQEQLTHQAYHDSLTRLPNRSLFQSRLEVALARANRRKRTMAVLFLDLDGFKVINDSLGHETGDELLRRVADRLQDAIRDEDTVARMSGDEFTVLLEEVVDEAEAAVVAQRIIDTIRQPIDLGGHQVFVGASVGIAVSRGGNGTVDDLLRDADLAMYRAKERGRSRFEIFETTMGARARLRLDLEAELRQALDGDELVLHYQPEVDLETGRIVGTEALVRWQHPNRGLLGPDAFIPMAEETGLILDVGCQVLEKACAQAAAWRERFGEAAPSRMSVNVSGRQLPTLVGDVTRALAATGADPRTLVLEITESVVMDDPEAAIPTFQALREMGVSIAIDDFGTGYSSLSWLKHFPISTLKLDKSFVQGLGVDPADRAIAQSVLTMAECLGVSVTAEGIETPEQAAELTAMGCRFGQGYHYARPKAPAAITRLLKSGAPLGGYSGGSSGNGNGSRASRRSSSRRPTRA